MWLPLFLLLIVLRKYSFTSISFSVGRHGFSSAEDEKTFSWMENLVQLPFENNETLVDYLNGSYAEIPPKLKPFINETAFTQMRIKHNDTEDWIIRDEDVAEDDEVEEGLNQAIHDGNKTNIKISPEAGQQLFQHWIDQAVSGLMAVAATNTLLSLPKYHKRIHHNCTDHAKTVAAHAKCVVQLLDARRKEKKKGNRKKTIKKTLANFMKKKTLLAKRDERKEDWIGSFGLRAKRETLGWIPKRQIKQKSTYSLGLEKKDSLLTQLAKKLTKTIRVLKSKDSENFHWENTIGEIIDEGKKLKKIEKIKKQFDQRMNGFMEVVKGTGVDMDPILEAMDMVDDEFEMKSKEQRVKEAREMEKKMTPEEKMMQEPIKLMREGMKLGMMMAGQNVSDFDNKTLRMFSPRIMSLIPEEEQTDADTIHMLSPSLFSFYNKSRRNELFSLPQLMKSFDGDGHENLMNFIFEAAGVSDVVTYMKAMRQEKQKEEMMERMEKAQEARKMRVSRDEAMKIAGDFETRRMDALERLQTMFTKDQMVKMNKTGYFGMNEEQLEFVYGDDSPFNNTKALKTFRNFTEKDTKRAIDNTIRALAKEEVAFNVNRQKDIVLAPITFTNLVLAPDIASQPIILSPVLMSTLILSPAVFGTVILSPWAFVPVIVAPRILGPVVLSPILFAPVILSPLALNPIILSPGAGVPFVLSPFVLSPFILNPVVLTPIILSPFALSPLIAVPNALTPLILSPFVLSPLIWSPPAVSAFVLNPYALSPVIQSDGAVFTAVLSPSWLS